uniref:Uncharacterized protein n=1 Tax=Lactuca sativa TaxID=4236 RepID=A0A9R1VK45_LACSA|nr:hypothetical protein LSAT_V11C500232450 [Lactuca sativa]
MIPHLLTISDPRSKRKGLFASHEKGSGKEIRGFRPWSGNQKWEARRIMEDLGQKWSTTFTVVKRSMSRPAWPSSASSLAFHGTKHQSHQDYLEKADRARNARLHSAPSK